MGASYYPARVAIPGGAGKKICIFHNYDIKKGCSRAKSNSCTYDHDHCHFCLGPGHVAAKCSLFRATLDDASALEELDTDKNAPDTGVTESGLKFHSIDFGGFKCTCTTCACILAATAFAAVAFWRAGRALRSARA